MDLFSTSRSLEAQGNLKGRMVKSQVIWLTLSRPCHAGTNCCQFVGDTVHTLVTSSGDGYQNFQTRILYSSYKIVQKMPGGEKMTGFTRILHRTVPDILMEEVPTFHVWDVLKPQCDGWCDYPVANRPNAILQYFQAADKNRSMINGAWILMAECDYVFMVPVRIPGDAHDKSVPGHQYHFDYIIPSHPDAAPHILKLYGAGKKITDVPASGPAPVILRLEDWLVLVPEYDRLSIQMEKDEPMKKQLGWVREMYAWDGGYLDMIGFLVLTIHSSCSCLRPSPRDQDCDAKATTQHPYGPTSI